MQGIAIITAAGNGTRAGTDKIWIKTGGKTVLERAADPFFAASAVDRILITVSAGKEAEARALFEGREKPCDVIVGGKTRTESVRNALLAARELVSEEDAIVAVHDGARPYVTRQLIDECMSVAAAKGSAIPAVPCTDSLRRISETGSHPIPREEIVRVQTPQCFRLGDLIRAYESGEEATDDATLYEKHVGPVTLIAGEENNAKITYLSDINKDIYSRVGIGFDVHPLRGGRRLILGGVEIPHDKGLDGHSDADVLTHAIMDALLTAAGLPDIGHRYPPNDDTYKDADSIELLRDVSAAIRGEGYRPINLSATVMAERPKLAPHLPQMEERIATALGISALDVKFAATTTEKLGIVGEEKGIAAEAIALIGRING